MEVKKLKKSLIYIASFVFLLVMVFGVFSLSVYANDEPPAGETPDVLTNPLGSFRTLQQAPSQVGTIIGGIFGVVGALAVLMIVYGGLMWMTSGGNQERVKKGRDVLVWATVGIVVIFSSYIILNFVLNVLTGTTAGQ